MSRPEAARYDLGFMDARPEVRSRATKVRDLALSPGGKKMIKYALVSVISVIVSQIVLGFFLFAFHWTAKSANVAAVAAGTVPSYYLNRTWVWGKSGRSHLMKEVAPFWALAFIGLAFSTWAADFAESFSKDVTDSGNLQKLIVMAGALSAFGVLWLGKFVIFNKILFAHRPQELEDMPALDGRTGLPT
jgi:putative flippase GtrA